MGLQSRYESFFLVADWHALTTDYEGTRSYAENTREMVIDWIAAGIDPDRSPVFVQSQVKQHAELHLLFSMLISTARLERNPTLKEQVRDLDMEGSLSIGHLAYPVLQSADILIYKGNVVPVGEDQLPHVEVTRELARRFNNTYAPDHAIFPEPEPLVTQFPRLPGLDGNKMSKSLGNTILLSDAPDEIKSKLRRAVTDPQKVRKGDPGRPDVCLVYTYHKKFNSEQTAEIRANCESGALGCVDCKLMCATKIGAVLEPIRARRAEIEGKAGRIDEIIADGNRRARAVAAQTMSEVHEAMGFGA